LSFGAAFLGLQVATWAGGAAASGALVLLGAWGLALGAEARRQRVIGATAAVVLGGIAVAWAFGQAGAAQSAALVAGVAAAVAAGSLVGLRAAPPPAPMEAPRREAPEAPVAAGVGSAPSLEPSTQAGGAPASEHVAEPRPQAATADLERTLRTLRAELRAGRAVVWSVALDERLATARAAHGGGLPPVANVEGDPLLWAVRERAALRADRPPRWAPDAEAAGIAFAGELDGLTSALTLEFADADALPDLAALENAGARVAAALRLEAAEDEAGLRVRHASAVLDATRRLATRVDPTDIAAELCDAAVSLVGDGAALATWGGDGGTVLGQAGGLGGPEPGDAILAPESQMAIAARSGAPLRRARGGRGDGPPVAGPGERWAAPWRDLVVFPLAEPGSGPVAVLAVWAREAGGLREEGLRWLEGVSGIAAAQLRQAERYGALQAEAEFDELTGILNRRAFENRLSVEVARYDRYRRPLSLILAGLDHFKTVSDRFGHEVGSQALRRVAEATVGAVRGADTVARLGGAEFGVLLPETGAREAAEVAERIRTAVAAVDLRHDAVAIALRVSVGVSACPECVEGAELLEEAAQEALRAAERGGRDRVAVAATARIPEPGAG
ncbi:MAG: GGDEF domain-containing protein, partial [Gemmatimonadota bacterium]